MRFVLILVCRLCLCSMLSASYALAQQGSRQTAVTIANMGWAEPVEDIYYQSAGVEHMVKALPFKRGSAQQYRGSELLEFYRYIENGEGRRERLTVGSVSLPPEGGALLLVWFPLGQGLYRILALPEDNSFPEGTARIFNATNAPVVVKTQSGIIQLPPGEYSHCSGGDGFLKMQVAYSPEGNGEWKVGFNNVYRLPANNRRTIFIASSDFDQFKLSTKEGKLKLGEVQAFSIMD